jgi:hypothetical protein
VVRQPNGLPILGALDSAVALEVGKGYQITAAISRATEAQLAGAGTAYPDDVVATYLDTTGVTQRTRELAQSLVAAAGATDPYHQGKALAAYLQRDPRFTYATRAVLPEDQERDLVDFFLFDENGQVGYCEYYATAMAVMARSLGIPARVAVGYAPGERIEQGVYQYRQRNAHLWAELYFPGYGWQIFESTKSIDPVVRLSGSGTVPPIVDPVGGVDPPNPFDEGVDPGNVNPLPSFEPVDGGFQPGEEKPAEEAQQGNALVVVIGLSLLVLVLAWRLLRGRGRFRFMAPGELQWQRLALAADRAGVGRRPSETIYEYAGWLEEQLPRQRVPIAQIADGKVWQDYSGRSVTAEAIERLERAWAKLRVPIAWLAVRRRARSFFLRKVD